ncbi:hypothetical protein NitYY0826_C1430 [Nitratiruptor sp. YY08-26]|uniref:EI24 domain-containing protein n=1 Tax=unclassified Nitratiruptor TaxID=2624044 RepID=UPI0019153E0D|nr:MULTISPECIES: EI24 domain-containing protein [unclassified Nitratiruptor]BCD62552.1 hypothetical protein NitYY0813_C1428 [Nitratiruptor sp. YY08-13]BCD66488.1 hypothetical protein NitYY0826_C1430 [Nitratiruptor sp. YY08-26]
MQKSIFVAAFEDFLTKKFLTLTFAPFFITLIIFAGIAFGSIGNIIELLSQVAQNPQALQDPDIASFFQAHPWFAAIAGSFIFKIIFGTLLAIFGTLLAILASTAIATIVMGFFTPIVVKEIHKRHYNHIVLEGSISIGEYIVMMLKVLLKTVGVFFLAAFAYFIPLLNVIALNIPFYYLFHSFLSLDVGGEIMRKKELEEILKKYRLKIMSTTGILYLITLIPFAGMLLQVYFVAVMAHLFFRLRS